MLRPPFENSLNNQSRAAPMPRFGSFCVESVLRVPKETSLRIVRSMLRASISVKHACATSACEVADADNAHSILYLRVLRTIFCAAAGTVGRMKIAIKMTTGMIRVFMEGMKRCLRGDSSCYKEYPVLLRFPSTRSDGSRYTGLKVLVVCSVTLGIGSNRGGNCEGTNGATGGLVICGVKVVWRCARNSLDQNLIKSAVQPNRVAMLKRIIQVIAAGCICCCANSLAPPKIIPNPAMIVIPRTIVGTVSLTACSRRACHLERRRTELRAATIAEFQFE